ncbi:MAG: hypothetical protein AMJ60_10315 [Desulfobacterales bacterium SG8_35]|nr:MAG: hypothetical protein AMJ60_10315 [Desulfobacterales bacterium SG8_35]
MAERKKKLTDSPKQNSQVLLIYYSFSGQTGVLINRLAAGLKEQGIEVFFEKLKPVKHLRFPVGSILRTYLLMLTTFFRKRVPIRELSAKCSREYDLIILAGPTWSYNPSGPILSFLDRDGKHVMGGREVLPLISCRGYWKAHWWGLKRKLVQCGAHFSNMIAFSHPNPEPWRTIGVFMKIAGKNPERSGFMGKYYKRFGHSNEQMEEAFRFGMQIGDSLKGKTPLAAVNFQTELALP